MPTYTSNKATSETSSHFGVAMAIASRSAAMALTAADMPETTGREADEVALTAAEVAAATLLMRVRDAAAMGRPEESTMIGLVKVG